VVFCEIIVTISVSKEFLLDDAHFGAEKFSFKMHKISLALAMVISFLAFLKE